MPRPRTACEAAACSSPLPQTNGGSAPSARTRVRAVRGVTGLAARGTTDVGATYIHTNEITHVPGPAPVFDHGHGPSPAPAGALALPTPPTPAPSSIRFAWECLGMPCLCRAFQIGCSLGLLPWGCSQHMARAPGTRATIVFVRLIQKQTHPL